MTVHPMSLLRSEEFILPRFITLRINILEVDCLKDVDDQWSLETNDVNNVCGQEIKKQVRNGVNVMVMWNGVRK